MNTSSNKPYANYYERKIDEEREVQKDVVKRGIIGPAIKNMLSENQKR